ncbi:hypothetical protein RB195_026268 [Necator americanus]|uniref:Serpentine receptor class gamma n=1 Tax=Necator americanus TaxID=51031 RepID=A0ABR1EW67_NECAM
MSRSCKGHFFVSVRQMWVISVSRSRILLCVCVQFFADVFFYLEFTVLMRFRKYGLLNEFFTTYSQLLTVVPPISIGLHYYIKMVVYLGEISVAANRLTSAMRPVSYEKIWNPWFIWQYVVYASQHTLRLETDPESTKVLALVDMVSSTSATIASLIMYISTVCRIRQLFRKQITNGNVQSNSNDCRLLLSALIMFLVYTPNTAMQVLTIAFKDKLSQVMFVNDLSYPVVDMMYSCPPWALLITSSKLRLRLWRGTRKRLTNIMSTNRSVYFYRDAADTYNGVYQNFLRSYEMCRCRNVKDLRLSSSDNNNAFATEQRFRVATAVCPIQLSTLSKQDRQPHL